MQSAMTVCFVTFSLGIFAQSGDNAKTLRRGLSRELWEVYQVSPADKKIKNGTYEVLTDSKDLLVKGQYKDGKKDGIWEYYSGGVPIQRYDFSSGQLVFNEPDSVSIVKSTYAVEAVTNEGDTVVPPYKIGGVNYGFFLLYDPRSLPPELKSMTSNVQMTYIFTISEEGKLLDWTVLYAGNAVSESAQKQSLYRLPADAYEFVAARVNGKPVRSKLTYVVPISVDHTTEKGPSNGNVTKNSVQ